MVIAAVDLREAHQARDAIVLGARLAGAYDDELRAVTVCETAAQASSRAAAVIDLLADVGATGSVEVLIGGSPARLLHDLGDREGPKVLVIGSGSRGPGGRAQLGNVTEALLHGGAVPVAIAPHGYATVSHVLSTIGVAFAGTPESWVALDRAAELAAAVRARLEIVTAREPGEPPEAGERRLDDARARVSADAVGGTVLDGPPAGALAAARGLSLLVVGSRSYGPLRAVLLGAVTRELIPVAVCPVMIVPRLPPPTQEVVLPGGMEAPPAS